MLRIIFKSTRQPGGGGVGCGLVVVVAGGNLLKNVFYVLLVYRSPPGAAYIYVSVNRVHIGPGNGLPPIWHQAII